VFEDDFNTPELDRDLAASLLADMELARRDGSDLCHPRPNWSPAEVGADVAPQPSHQASAPSTPEVGILLLDQPLPNPGQAVCRCCTAPTSPLSAIAGQDQHEGRSLELTTAAPSSAAPRPTTPDASSLFTSRSLKGCKPVPKVAEEVATCRATCKRRR
jgi:hypothetical protein